MTTATLDTTAVDGSAWGLDRFGCGHTSCLFLASVMAELPRTVRDGRVMVGESEAGQIADRSWATFDGRLVERWSGFAGGDHVGNFPTEDIAAHAVRQYAERAATGFRYALHG